MLTAEVEDATNSNAFACSLHKILYKYSDDFFELFCETYGKCSKVTQSDLNFDKKFVTYTDFLKDTSSEKLQNKKLKSTILIELYEIVYAGIVLLLKEKLVA